MSATAVTTWRDASRRLPRAHPQLSTAAAQLIAGVGNMLFALVVARLVPSGYGQVAAFLGAYLLVHVPLTSATAAASVRPQRLAALRRTLFIAGAGGGAVLAALAPLAPALGWRPAAALTLAAALPAAGLLAIERGRLLAARADGRFAATLVVEPAVRLGAGIALTVALGPLGAALGVVAGGYAALAVAATGKTPRAPRSGASAAGGRAVAGTFTALAAVQTQDVVLAGAVLTAGQAADFGALSTLGGIAAFATTTVPLVLLPRAVAGERGALRSALLIATGLGVAALLPALVAPRLLMTVLAGEPYADVASLAAPYLAAMALLGVARVLLAHRAALAPGPGLIAALTVPTAAQTALVLTAETPADVVRATVIAGIALLGGAAALAVPALRQGPTEGGLPAPVGIRKPEVRPPAAPVKQTVAALMLAALAIRLISGRSLWLDEATSVSHAQMPFPEMLERLRSSDVHPPLHEAILWVLAHTFGTDAVVMRAPSLIAGTALIGVIYLAGRELWDHRAGLVAALFATVAPFAIWYSQEARMYELFMLFSALAVYGQARVLRRGDLAGWLTWGVATTLMLWTHYFAVLPIAAQVGAFMLVAWRRRELIAPLVLALATIALVCAPLALFAHAQFAANEASGRGFNQTPTQHGEAGHGIPGPYAVLTNVAWALWGYHSSDVMARLTALWPLLMLLALGLLGRGRDIGARTLWALVLVPLLGLLALGHAKPFLFEARYFAGAVPALLLLLAQGATRWTGGRRAAVTLATVAIAGSFGVAAADQQLSRTNPRLYDFRGALARVEAAARPGDTVVYTPAFLGDLVRYYAPGLHARELPRDGVPPRVAPGRRLFLLASFQNEPQHATRTDRALEELARRKHFERVIRRPQVEVWVYR